MARVNTYLNFQGQTEEAMTFYRDLFGGTFVGPLHRFGDMGVPGLTDDEAKGIMHMEVEITAGHVLMATDMVASMGQVCRVGNNTTIMVELEDRAEVDRLYAGLAAGTEESAPADMPWGQYWSCCLDRFGIRWMLATPLEAQPA